MTWIDWATVACAVYAALLSTLVAIRQQLRIKDQQRILTKIVRSDRERHTHRQQPAEPGIQAGDPVYWDGRGKPVAGQLFPGCAAATLAEPKTPLHDVDVAINPALGASILGVALNDSQPVDPGVVE